MLHGYRHVFPMILIILGVIWCVEIFKRRDEDLHEVRESKEPFDKYIVIAYWIATAIIIYFLATSGLGYIMRLVRGMIDMARW
ncbi:MAG: hypothetical protein ACKVT0_12470 [Planctomycetaceae bacterium]